MPMPERTGVPGPASRGRLTRERARSARPAPARSEASAVRGANSGGHGVGVGGAHRRLDDRDALRGEDGVEAGGELAVAVVEQVADRPGLALLQVPAELAGLLRHPGGVRVRGTPGEVDAARPELDKA